MSKYKYKGVIFDLDGTLLDTLDDLMNSVNYALRKNGYKERTKEEIRRFVGNGIKKLIFRALNYEENDTKYDALEFDKVFSDFKTHYEEHCNDCTNLYPGIKELLIKLNNDEIKTAIVSNKADFGVQKLKEIYFDNIIDAAKGEDETIQKKPSPDMVMAVLKDIGVKPEECVYVGDSDVDIMTARNCGMDCISVLWGFRDKDFLVSKGATMFANTPDEIIMLISNN